MTQSTKNISTKSDYRTYGIKEIATDKIIYVGSTSRTLQERFRGHSYNNTTAISKYVRLMGIGCFEMVQLGVFNTKKQSLRHEKRMLKKYDTFTNGLNNTKSGQGGVSGVNNRVRQQRTTIIDGEQYILPMGVYSFNNKGSNKKFRVCFEHNKKYINIAYCTTVEEAEELHGKAVNLIQKGHSLKKVKQLLKSK